MVQTLAVHSSASVWVVLLYFCIAMSQTDPNRNKLCTYNRELKLSDGFYLDQINILTDFKEECTPIVFKETSLKHNSQQNMGYL